MPKPTMETHTARQAPLKWAVVFAGPFLGSKVNVGGGMETTQGLFQDYSHNSTLNDLGFGNSTTCRD